ncbi:MAG: invasion associated locus B family protein [Pseudomonadota bacterium]
MGGKFCFSGSLRTRAVALMLVAVFPCAAHAATETDHSGDFRDWSTFIDRNDDGSKICYMTSLPKASRESKSDVKRDESFIMIARWPIDGDRVDQVRLTGGYPYATSSQVDAVVDDRKFELFTDGETAWAYDGDDPKIIAAMKKGIKLTVRGVSARGTTTWDEYSLRGFTAAYNRIVGNCSS